MNHMVVPRVGINRLIVKRITGYVVLCLMFLAAAAVGAYFMTPVTLDFPDFPFGVAVVDLGQSLAINVDATHDGAKGVTWNCVGDACTKLTTTTRWATFYASGITGTATITVTSIKQPSVHKSLKITVYLNAVPDMLCDSALFARGSVA